ncbi:dienelactone hydrolase family protein [Massilia sp. CCM 9210]|uniref:dienelactone hydrolase family protein n=1 Tax=Massilia scottii TaxID=3057166 RepID=UPI002796991B|nr:alpha/beta family hydrolase [Massilia sp. CCM 9210]MDQ1812358.1 dienelactone hydrolase family protein [Massilia sp. CCM 9210]
MHPVLKELVTVKAGQANLEGMLELPDKPLGVVLFAHGSGSSRLSPRNVYVADQLCRAGVGTLLIDLLTQQEDRIAQSRFDIALLTDRLSAVIAWLRRHDSTRSLPIGLFGASTGGAAALQAAASNDADIAAVVSRGGRPDMAGQNALEKVRAPTLLIVGGRDDAVIRLNRAAFSVLRCEKRLDIIPHATHLFEEPGTLEAVAALAAQWFGRHLPASR